MARAMGTNAYGKEPRRGERTLSRGFTHRRARRAFLRPYGAGASLGRSHRAYALGYFLVPLTGLRTEQPERAVLGLPAPHQRRPALALLDNQLFDGMPLEPQPTVTPRKAVYFRMELIQFMEDVLSLIHISEPTRLGMISYAV